MSYHAETHCTVYVTIPYSELCKFTSVFHTVPYSLENETEAYESWSVVTERHDGLVDLIAWDINCGGITLLEYAASRGCSFIGHHTSSDTYSAHRFFSHDGHLLKWPGDNDGEGYLYLPGENTVPTMLLFSDLMNAAEDTLINEKVRGWYVYMLECSDGTTYTGITTNVERRLAEHSSGKGSKYTRGRLPIRLLGYLPSFSRSRALVEEARVKKLSRTDKTKLVEEWDDLLALATVIR